MSNRMTKRITRKAKDTIIELVKITRIVVTHKLGLKTKIQQSRSSHSLHPEKSCTGKETQSSFFNSRPICTNPLLKFTFALSERHRSLVQFNVKCLLESPHSAMMLIRTKRMSRDLISVLVTSRRSMQRHTAKFTLQNAHTRECIS